MPRQDSRAASAASRGDLPPPGGTPRPRPLRKPRLAGRSQKKSGVPGVLLPFLATPSAPSQHSSSAGEGVRFPGHKTHLPAPSRTTELQTRAHNEIARSMGAIGLLRCLKHYGLNRVRALTSLQSLPNRNSIKIITAFFINERPQITLHQVTCSSQEAEAMTDLTKATRFLADQRKTERERKKRNPPFQSLLVKVNIKAAALGKTSAPKLPDSIIFFTFPLVKKKCGGGASLWCLVCTPSVLQQRS